MNSNFKAIGLTRLEIKPVTTASKADALATLSSELLKFTTTDLEQIEDLGKKKTQTHNADRTKVGKFFPRRARFGKTVEAAGRTLIGKQGEDLFFGDHGPWA